MLPQNENDDERWEEIRKIHQEYRLFYQIAAGGLLLGVGIIIGVGASAAENTGGILVGILVGLVTGLVTNLASWWILFHGIVPTIHFIDIIKKHPQSEIQGNASGYGYTFRLENSGMRSVIDVELMVRLRLKGLGRFPKSSWHIVNIPVDGDYPHRIPRLRPGKQYHSFELTINDVSEFAHFAAYPDTIREKSVKKTLLLEDLLMLGSEANLEIAAFGYHEYSGARKLFLSKHYTIDDIKQKWKS